MKRFTFLFALVFLTAFACGPWLAAVDLAVRGTIVYPVSGPPIDEGVVLIEISLSVSMDAASEKTPSPDSSADLMVPAANFSCQEPLSLFVTSISELLMLNELLVSSLKVLSPFLPET